MTSDDRLRGAALGLASAVLFGLSAPFAKLLLPGAGPLWLAGLLYLGGGAAFLMVRRSHTEARLTRAEAPILASAVLLGAALAPPLMLWGLTRVSGLTGSLLLNLEAPLTMALAVALFGEHLSRREAIAAALLVLGGAVVGAHGERGLTGSTLGALAIGLACLCWAIDNNLSARLSLKDPVVVVRIKMLSAGALNFLAAAFFESRLPQAHIAAGALVLGAFSYGVSYLFYLKAQRILGAARQGALFALAPFAGAAVAMPLLGDRPTASDLGGAAVMATGLVLLLRARHAHAHTHARTEHEHLHVHDEHHRHAHDGPVAEPHSHLHQHEPLTHEHPHVSDAHHKHRH
jgi:drug/metabolite transporter (DMT)-like permease